MRKKSGGSYKTAACGSRAVGFPPQN